MGSFRKPHLAVIHAGCAGAVTAEQHPAPRGARRSGEASGGPWALGLVLPSERGVEAEGQPQPGLLRCPGQMWPAGLSKEWRSGLRTALPCAMLGLLARWLPRVLCRVAGHPSSALPQDQAGPAPPPVCLPVKSPAQLAGFLKGNRSDVTKAWEAGRGWVRTEGMSGLGHPQALLRG